MSQIDHHVTAVTVRRSASGQSPSPDHLLVVAEVSVSTRGQAAAVGSVPAVFVADDGSEHPALPIPADGPAMLEPYTSRPVRVLFDVPRRLAISGRVRFATAGEPALS